MYSLCLLLYGYGVWYVCKPLLLHSNQICFKAEPAPAQHFYGLSCLWRLAQVGQDQPTTGVNETRVDSGMEAIVVGTTIHTHVPDRLCVAAEKITTSQRCSQRWLPSRTRVVNNESPYLCHEVFYRRMTRALSSRATCFPVVLKGSASPHFRNFDS